MNLNRKIFAVFSACLAAMFSVTCFLVLPRLNKFFAGIIARGRWDSDVSIILSRMQTEYLTTCVILIFASILLAFLFNYGVNLILKPVNLFIERLNKHFSSGKSAGLEEISARVGSICSNAGILEVVPIGVMMVDQEGIIRIFNREAGEITALDPDAVIGRPMLHFFPNNYYNYTLEVISTGREHLGLRNIIKVGAFFRELLLSISPIYNDDVITGAVAVFQDVTPQRKLIEVQAAYTLAKDLASQKDLGNTVRVIAKAAAEMVDIEYSAILLADGDQRLMILSAHGIPEAVIESYNAAPYSLNSPEITGLYRNKVPLLHGDVRNKPAVTPHLLMPGIASFYSFPIIYEDGIIGFMNLYSREKNKLSKDMIYLLQSLSGQVNTAIANFYELQKMRAMAMVDGLTGLFNKNCFQETINNLLTEISSAESSLSLAMIDIDRFKNVNDTYGHQAGDILLKEIAGLIQQSLRSSDYAYRYGGEEFAVIMPDTAKEAAIELTDGIRLVIEKTVFSLANSNEPVSITVSAGVASFPVDAVTPEDLIMCSDTALYAAKKSGRNRVAGYGPGLNQ